MRLLTVVAPGGEARQAEVSRALAAWNRGLDIRLRFLNVGVEEAVLVPAAGGDARPAPGAGLEEVEGSIRRERPALVLLHGGGPLALAAAITATKAALPLVRTGAGRRPAGTEGEERAADRLSSLRLADGAAEVATLRAEGLEGAAEEVGPAGSEGAAERVVKAVLRVLRDL